MSEGRRPLTGAQFREALALALDTVRTHRLRSGLVILGVAIGVATLMGMVSILRGLGKKIEADVTSADRVVLIAARFDFFSEDPSKEDVRKRRAFKPGDAQFVAEQCQLLEMVNFYMEPSGPPTVLRYRGRRTNFVQVVGAAPEMAYIYSIPLAQGRLFTREELEHRRRVALLGYGPAHDLFPNEDPVGKKLRIREDEYEVVGAFGERKNIFGSMAENYLVVPYTTFIKDFGQRTDERYIQAALRPGAVLEDAVEEMTRALRIRRRLAPGAPNDFNVVSSNSIAGFVSRLTKPIGLALVVISSIGLMVGGIGVMNIMLVSVTERTREIGVRKAVGATRQDVLLQILIEAASLTSVGGLLGVAGGLLLALVIRQAAGFPMAVTPFIVILAVTFSAAIGIGFGLWPAWRAASQDPIEALRYE